MKPTADRIATKFNLSADLTARLAESVPAGKRSRFVEAAIDVALKAKAKQALLDMLDSAPVHSTGGESSVEVLRKLRQHRTAELAERHKPLAQ